MPHHCNGGACFSLPTPACGRMLSQLLREAIFEEQLTPHASCPGSPLQTDDRADRPRRNRPLRHPRARAHARRYLSASRRPGNLCGAAPWRHGSRADGRLPDVLLRVSLPLHHGHRSRGEQEHSRRRPHETGISDRKSTRLNSSHLVISYAVSCLKKKKNRRKTKQPTTSTLVATSTLSLHQTL